MRIWDNDKAEELRNITVYLTPSEARELQGYVEQLLETTDYSPNEPGDHHHLNDPEYQREMTLTVYTPENIKYLNAGSQRLILGR